MIKNWRAKKSEESRKRFQQAAKNNTIANMYACEEITAEQAITALAEQVDEMGDRLVELGNVRPRKFELPDGTIKLWRCPEDQIPTEKL